MAGRYIRFLMTREDEAEFSRRLREAVPEVQFFDDDTSRPPCLLAGLEKSTSTSAKIHDGSRSAESPSWRELGPLIQFHGSARRDSPLESLRGATLREGTLSICFDDDDDATRRFVNRVCRVLRGMTTNKVQQINPASESADYGEVRDIHIAAHAIAFVRGGGLLAATSANVYYRPLGDVPLPKPSRRRGTPT